MSTVETPTGLWLDAGSAGLLMSPAEFDAATEYDDSVAYELIHGVLVVTPMSGFEVHLRDLLAAADWWNETDEGT
jgi:hypothetical protein